MGGLFGIASTQDCVKDLFYGTDYHSHLGTKRAGMAVVNKKGFTRSIHNIENAYFRSKFEPELHDFRGTSGIGVISDFDAQPLIINSHLGTFAIVTVGRINNIEALGRTAFARKKYFSETSGSGINPTELISMLVCEEKSFKDGISSVFRSIKGSCTLMILTKKGIIAARDRLGRTPLAIGRKNGSLAVTSETCALSNLGYEAEYYLGPGEIVHITADGFEQLAPAGSEMQVCSFLWVYYGYPPSNYENINVEMVRYRCGRALARNDTVEADLVSGIPDSGIGHAVGYANEKHIPYMRPYTKYTPTWPRSFMPQSQAVRDLVAKMKLIPNRSVIENNRIVFCDDSIVRGTQLKDNVRILFDYGAREVHMRVACPTLIYPCEFLNFSSSRSSLDLAGRKAIYELEGTNHVSLEEYARAGSEKNLAMVEKIRQRLGLTSLKFQTMDDLVEAIGLPKEKLCTHCWDGSSRC
ncbi:MAG TPA: amidophosphoribosyltransferase [Deltaproteobacteria bacterium]|nr:amidophosphoribosyltransferase [Deltaproteobacteria bacterium]MDI9542155.1 amidophosphoribosyltransferase [Pseudomonadota bacterium]HON60727.1 amidophosphoribosyltransferase [Deltaproteobacteria bacterium]